MQLIWIVAVQRQPALPEITVTLPSRIRPRIRTGQGYE